MMLCLVECLFVVGWVNEMLGLVVVLCFIRCEGGCLNVMLVFVLVLCEGVIVIGDLGGKLRRG